MRHRQGDAAELLLDAGRLRVKATGISLRDGLGALSPGILSTLGWLPTLGFCASGLCVRDSSLRQHLSNVLFMVRAVRAERDY